MQLAFQQFMLSGGGNKNTDGASSGTGKKKKNQGTLEKNLQSEQSVVSKNSPSQEHKNSLQQNKTRKRYRQILEAFQKTLKEDWMDVDDHLGDVMASIVNLRERIRMSSKHLWKWEQNLCSQAPPEYQGFAYRNYPSYSNDIVLGHLIKDDVELALFHALSQHEKMLAGSRRLLSSLNQAQEVLGRRLDELVKFNLDANQYLCGGEESELKELELFASQVVDWSRQVYIALAKELHRKQELVQNVLDSATDHLLFQEDDEIILDDDDDELSPMEIAEKCHRFWPRGSDGESSDLAELLVSRPWQRSDGNK